LVVASSILTFAGLAVLGIAVAAVYALLVARRPGAQRPPGGTLAARPGPVSVRAIVARLAVVGDQETIFLDRGTGRFVTLGDELLAELESDEPLDEPLDFSVAQLEELRRKLRSKTLLSLPTKAETREFLLRERFCGALPEGEAKEQMLKVLRGQTGYRSFEAAVARLQIAEQWQRYRDEGFATVATAWLQRNRIPYGGGIPAADTQAERELIFEGTGDIAKQPGR